MSESKCKDIKPGICTIICRKCYVECYLAHDGSYNLVHKKDCPTLIYEHHKHKLPLCENGCGEKVKFNERDDTNPEVLSFNLICDKCQLKSGIILL